MELDLEYPSQKGFVTSVGSIERSLGKIDTRTLVKEVGQNSLDAMLDENKPVEVHFSLFKMPKNRKKELLQQCGLVDLEKVSQNLDKMIDSGDKNESRRYQRIRENLKRKEDAYFLVISDYNTHGLTGSDKLNLKDPSRFQGYNFKLGISQKDTSRGSFGEGRLAALSTSSIQYVYQVSHLSEPYNGKFFRIFGLGLHGLFQETEDDIKLGVFFSCKLVNGEVRSMMVNDIDNQSELIDKQRTTSKGTSFVFPLFDPVEFMDNGGEDEQESIELFLKELRIASEEVFFPSIANERLEIHIKYHDLTKKSKESYSDFIRKNNLAYLYKYLAGINEDDPRTNKILPYTNGTRLRYAELRIPQGIGAQRLIEQLSVRFIDLYRDGNMGGLPTNYRSLVNKTILSRNGMVIDYYDTNLPLKDYFIGLLDVTLAEFPDAHEFFRLSEPVKHDRWLTTARRLRDRYGKSAGPAMMREFYRNLKTVIQDEFGYDPSVTKSLSEQIKSEIFDQLGYMDIGVRTEESFSTKDYIPPITILDLSNDKIKKTDENGVHDKEKDLNESEDEELNIDEPIKPLVTIDDRDNKNKERETSTKRKEPKKPRTTISKDLVRLKPIQTHRDSERIDIELHLPKNIEKIHNMQISTTLTELTTKTNFVILDNNNENIDDLSVLTKVQFPILLRIYLDTIPKRIRKNLRIGVVAGGRV